MDTDTILVVTLMSAIRGMRSHRFHALVSSLNLSRAHSYGKLYTVCWRNT